MMTKVVEESIVDKPMCEHLETTVLENSKDVHGIIHELRVYCHGCGAFIPKEDKAAQAAISQHLKDKK